MLFFILLAIYPLVVRGALIPEMATVESCTDWHIVVTDKNVRKAIEFFRSCRNLGLTMGDLLPEDYMKTLATNLKTSNYQFLQQSNFAQPKLRIIEREFNDLYQEITILSERVVGRYMSHGNHDKRCTCTTKPTTVRTTNMDSSTMVPSLDQDDPHKIDPDDYDYGSSMNPCSEPAFYIYILAIVCFSFLVSLWTCTLANKTYKLLKDCHMDDEAYINAKGESR